MQEIVPRLRDASLCEITLNCALFWKRGQTIRLFIFTNLMHKFFIFIHLLHSSTCFEHYCAHLQDESPLVTCVLNSTPKTVTIPDAVLIQLSS